MKVDYFIRELQNLRARHGNLSINVNFDCHEYNAAVQDVRLGDDNCIGYNSFTIDLKKR